MVIFEAVYSSSYDFSINRLLVLIFGQHLKIGGTKQAFCNDGLTFKKSKSHSILIETMQHKNDWQVNKISVKIKMVFNFLNNFFFVLLSDRVTENCCWRANDIPDDTKPKNVDLSFAEFKVLGPNVHIDSSSNIIQKFIFDLNQVSNINLN